MAQQSKKRKARKRKEKIRFSSRAQLVNKNDATRVARTDTTRYPRMAAQMPRSNGMVLKVKIKRK